MRYFIDTEFYEDGHTKPVQLISLALVAADGREFYVENKDVDLDRLSVWLRQNVVPYLRQKALVLPHNKLASAVVDFIGDDHQPTFWGYYASYDWMLFSQLFGTMMNLPQTFPACCFDLKQEMWRLGLDLPLIEGCGPKHHALSDARWNRALLNWMVEKKGLELP